MERAHHVHIVETEIEEYAEGLVELAADEAVADEPTETDAEGAAAFAICMNAINFGSGWWPTVRKHPGLSGYGTMAAGVRERFAADGPWRAEELAAMEPGAIADVVAQDTGHPLMAEFAAALGDVGAHLLAEFDGRYRGAAEGVESIPALASRFAGWEAFADVSSYEGREVPF